MAAILAKIYKIVEEQAGNNGRIRLAEMTQIPRTKAKQIVDTPEMVDYFKKTASEIMGHDIEPYLSNQ